MEIYHFFISCCYTVYFVIFWPLRLEVFNTAFIMIINSKKSYADTPWSSVERNVSMYESPLRNFWCNWFISLNLSNSTITGPFWRCKCFVKGSREHMRVFYFFWDVRCMKFISAFPSLDVIVCIVKESKYFKLVNLKVRHRYLL